MLDTKKCKWVKTRDQKGMTNGSLLEIASSLDSWSRFLAQAQVYLTTLKPKMKKGFHWHHKKTSQITCLRGSVVMGVWDGKKMREHKLSGQKPVTFRIPKNHALGFYNYGNEEAWLLNLCSPPYDPNDPEQEDLDLPWRPKV